jgi:hypothetical protein
LGIFEIENRKLKKSSLFPKTTKKKKKILNYQKKNFLKKKKNKNKIKIKFSHPRGRSPTSAWTLGCVRADALVSARTLGCVRADAPERPCGRARVRADAHERPRRRWAASARTRFLPRPRTVKTRPRVKQRPRGKRGRARTSGRRPDGNFPPISSFMTSLAAAAVAMLENWKIRSKSYSMSYSNDLF